MSECPSKNKHNDVFQKQHRRNTLRTCTIIQKELNYEYISNNISSTSTVAEYAHVRGMYYFLMYSLRLVLYQVMVQSTR